MPSMSEEDYGFNEAPIFNAGLGAVILLDDLLKLSSGYLLSGDSAKYYQTLEAIYIELIYWVHKKGKKHISEEEIEKLEQIRIAAKGLSELSLKKYHILLNKYANVCGLRLKTGNGLPGVMQG